jgi:phosphoglycolate phosphatase (TIGR01487 family)
MDGTPRAFFEAQTARRKVDTSAIPLYFLLRWRSPDLPFRLIACDYDGTIATDGVIPASAEQALIEAKQAGWLTALVTGRETRDLLQLCPQINLFDLAVVENGAVLYFPRTGLVEELVPPPDHELIRELARSNVPISKGRVIISAHREYEQQVVSVIRKLGLKLEVIFNRDSVMILPAGVSKASGLKVGLERLGVAFEEVIAIGDAENDHSFLQAAGFAVAVANALDSVKAEADLVTSKPNGDGLAEFIREHLLWDFGEGTLGKSDHSNCADNGSGS